MSELFGLIFSAALVNNIVLTYLVGLDLQIAASQRMNAAWLVGLATIYCLALSLPSIYLIDKLIIIPFALQFLDLLLYVLLIIIIVYASQDLIHRSLVLRHVDHCYCVVFSTINASTPASLVQASRCLGSCYIN